MIMANLVFGSVLAGERSCWNQSLARYSPRRNDGAIPPSHHRGRPEGRMIISPSPLSYLSTQLVCLLDNLAKL